jgi:hypothetical protein
MFLGSKLEDKISAPNDGSHSLTPFGSSFLHEWNIDFLAVFPNI